MVNVGSKPVTAREAIAEGHVQVSEELAEAIRGNSLRKGDLLAVARLAGIQAAKRTAELIPLCHNLPLEDAAVDAWLDGNVVRLRGRAKTTWKTGVEMEALTAVAVAALAVVDMGKAIDPGMVISAIRLVRKTGGTRGDYVPREARSPT